MCCAVHLVLTLAIRRSCSGSTFPHPKADVLQVGVNSAWDADSIPRDRTLRVLLGFSETRRLR